MRQFFVDFWNTNLFCFWLGTRKTRIMRTYFNIRNSFKSPPWRKCLQFFIGQEALGLECIFRLEAMRVSQLDFPFLKCRFHDLRVDRFFAKKHTHRKIWSKIENSVAKSTKNVSLEFYMKIRLFDRNSNPCGMQPWFFVQSKNTLRKVALIFGSTGSLPLIIIYGNMWFCWCL